MTMQGQAHGRRGRFRRVSVLALSGVGLLCGACLLALEGVGWVQAGQETPPEIAISLAEGGDFGTVWSQAEFEWPFKLRNDGPGEVVIERFELSGGCVRVVPDSLVLAAGETVELKATLDLLAKEVEETQFPTRKVEATIVPTIAGSAAPEKKHPGWTLRGKARNPLTVEQQSLDFGEVTVDETVLQGEPLGTKSVLVTLHQPVVELIAESDAATVEITPIKYSPYVVTKCAQCHGRYESARLDIRPRETLPDGEFSADVRLKVSLPYDSKEPIEGVPLQVSGRIRKPGASAMPAAAETLNDHWAFIRPTRPEPPQVRHTTWPRNAIDEFVLAMLEQKGMQPAPEADRTTLIRRLSLDLLGLPPTPAEVDAFVNDRRPDAYEQLVDRLLASPHFGERWGRLWLDLAHYADSDGYDGDGFRPFAYRYRDWVIEAINADLPFDQFTIDQLAGDLLPDRTYAQVLATGFHRNTTTNREGGVNPEETRIKEVIERVNTTGTVWLGLTVGCAECHDHRYDPLTQVDYYRLMAFFNQAENGVVATPSPDAYQKWRRDQEAYRQAAAIARQAFEEVTLDASGALARAQTDWQAWTEEQNRQWIVLDGQPRSAAGAEFTRQPDGSWLVSGASAATDTYTLTLSTDLQGISGLRLEALPDPTLPAGGAGRAPNGNFILTGVEVAAAAADHPHDAQPIPLELASADFSQEGFPVTGIIDSSAASGWGVAPQVNLSHTALIQLREDVGFTGGTVLTITLRQEYGREHTLGRFRILATAQPRPIRIDRSPVLPAPAPVAEILALSPAEWTHEQRLLLAEHYCTSRYEWNQAWHAARQGPAAFPVAIAAPALPERPLARRTYLHQRGDFLRRGAEVTPGFPAFLTPSTATAPSAIRTNETPGAASDGGFDGESADWVTLLPESVTCESNSVFLPRDQQAVATVQPDGSILVGGGRPEKDLYTVAATTDLTGITAIRLELLPDPSLPRNGPGRADDGSFTLNEFRLAMAPREGTMEERPVPLQNAIADFDPEKETAAEAIDGDPMTSWTLSRRLGKPHVAVFETSEAIGFPGGTRFVFTFDQQAKQKQIGRFRLSVSTAPRSLTLAAARSELPSNRLPDGSRRLDRLDLARWIVSPENPLTARVAVNRFWQQLFGRGFVTTPDDFGLQGSLPSHPQLLDWLATEFIAKGWSRKALLKQICCSATYRQSSVVASSSQEKLPLDHWFGRQKRQRLDAELIRDTALAVGGILNREIGGPSVHPPLPAGVSDNERRKWPAESETADHHRRGMYVTVRRSLPYPSLATFDTPDSSVSCVQRMRSNTPLQALTLLNDPVFFEAARGVALRLVRELPGGDREARLRQLVRLCLAREPQPVELAFLREFYENQAALYAADGKAAEQVAGTESIPSHINAAELAAWTLTGRALFNLDEFLTRE